MKKVMTTLVAAIVALSFASIVSAVEVNVSPGGISTNQSYDLKKESKAAKNQAKMDAKIATAAAKAEKSKLKADAKAAKNKAKADATNLNVNVGPK
jgi:uncharacterized membrane protein YqiK